jgi:hypothetical protein
MEQVVLKPQNLPEQVWVLANGPPVQDCPTISDFFTQAHETDSLPGEILKAIRMNGSLNEITVPECTEQGGYVQYRRKRDVPKDDELWLRLIQEHHDSVLARDPGGATTLDLVDRQYYRKDMRKQVDQYARNCLSCQQSRTSRHATCGVLQPLPVPEKPLEAFWMDFVVELPECEGFEEVWVVVDRLSKMRHCIPCHRTIEPVCLAKSFLREVVRLHGLPTTIISDQEPQFASIFCGQM